MSRNVNPKNQNGMSMISIMLIIGVVLFFLLLGIKMIPTYLNDMSIGTILEGMQDDPKVRKGTARDIKKIMAKRMQINGIYDFDMKKVVVKPDGPNRAKVSINYEVIEPVAGNVSVIMTFDHQVTMNLQ